MNIITKYTLLAVDILFLKQPIRTSLGLLYGLATKPILQILAAWLPVAKNILSANLSDLQFGLLGIALVHIPTARHYLLGKVSYLSENEEKAFAMIRELKLPESHKQLMYIKVVEKVLARIELKPGIEDDVIIN